jgi:hypothetical protein
VARKKKESGSGSFGEMVRRGAEKLARDPRAQRTAKKGVSSLVQRLRVREGWRKLLKERRGPKTPPLFQPASLE